ncbi:hypothetical protein BDK51DRAFT_42690 [Blyttiomyces helicus]|uniref:Uncharacterized protein n=1 Tax=Blyttiomyces helicus TaxID=388810 RepID=A0A4P9WSA5_9FUNG|nr:hypothetical protein BDK51DRAFT_42690 [Blyttiomyces helicus]|eukprot:RKO94180.1 hypothetical protein BDK51DRAFT_42690 [Blyttiomyces helicus]
MDLQLLGRHLTVFRKGPDLSPPTAATARILTASAVNLTINKETVLSRLTTTNASFPPASALNVTLGYAGSSPVPNAATPAWLVKQVFEVLSSIPASIVVIYDYDNESFPWMSAHMPGGSTTLPANTLLPTASPAAPSLCKLLHEVPDRGIAQLSPLAQEESGGHPAICLSRLLGNPRSFPTTKDSLFAQNRDTDLPTWSRLGPSTWTPLRDGGGKGGRNGGRRGQGVCGGDGGKVGRVEGAPGGSGGRKRESWVGAEGGSGEDDGGTQGSDVEPEPIAAAEDSDMAVLTKWDICI